MSINLQSLSDEISYHWKVQTAKSWGCECVAYIDARQVMDHLDRVVGPENWKDNYREISGKLFCELSIKVNGEWMTKSDCGSASSFEAAKGQSSDAFKRAAVKWGVGRFLYGIEPVRLKSIEGGKDNQGKPRYFPADEKGKRIYNLDHYISGLNNPNKPSAKSAHSGYTKGKSHAVTLRATREQKQAILDLGKTKRLGPDALKDLLANKKTDWKSLNQLQASELLLALEAMPESSEQPSLN